MFFVIRYIAFEIQQVVEFAVAYGTDRIRLALGNIVVNAVNVPAMFIRFARQHFQETGAIEVEPIAIAPSRFDQGRHHVRHLNECIGFRPGSNTVGPARDQPGMDAEIPVRPLGVTQRPTLLGRKKHERVLCSPRLIEQLQGLADFAVQVS